MEGTAGSGRSALGSGLLTALSTAVVTGTAAVGGAILARKFGHGVRTDGFFAAWGLYLALVLVGQTLRVVTLPPLARARDEQRLAGELGAWALALAVVFVPATVVVIAVPHRIADVLIHAPAARDVAAEILPWIVAGAVLQVFAGLAASALASLDDYAVAALAFGAGGVASLVVIVALLDHGVIAFGWGAFVNGGVALGLMVGELVRRRAVGWAETSGLGARLRLLVEGVSLPFALQGLYVISNRFAGGLGKGDATTFSYAYLIAAAFVAVTASSIALISSVTLTREGLEPERTARHVVAVSWLSLVAVALGAGVFALAGGPFAERVLGSEYGGHTGAELGRLVVYLAPWMVASIGVSITFPLLFVVGRARALPALAVGCLLVHVPVEWAARAVAGLAGVAAGMAVTTALVLLALTGVLRVRLRVARGLAVAAAVCGVVAAVAFAAPRAVLGPVAAAAVGSVAYALALAAMRPRGLREAWAYLRGLH